MKILIEKEEEPWEETMAYIDSVREHGDVPKVPLTECKIYQRGKYIILEHGGRVHYWEHAGNFCYLEEAISYMEIEKPASWKTLDKLITLRKAIRENTAQWMGLEYLYEEGLTLERYRKFITTARVFDEQHHGQATF